MMRVLANVFSACHQKLARLHTRLADYHQRASEWWREQLDRASR